MPAEATVISTTDATQTAETAKYLIALIGVPTGTF